MKFGTLTFRAMGGVAAFGAVLLGGCDAVTSVTGGADGQEVAAAALEPNLAQPAVGDLWAAKLDEFSSYEFGDNGEELPAAYGLMKVIEVEDDQLVLITEIGAWPTAEGTLGELGGDLAAISWDENENISVDRAELPALVEQGHILETRRMAE